MMRGSAKGLQPGQGLREDDNSTTVMLRNIPNKYTRQMLIEQLHRAGFRGDIDYLYLPTDFENRCNVGYCFVNLRTSLARSRFTAAFDGVAVQSCLPGFNSHKVCQVTTARWQGREENIWRLRSRPELMAQLAANPEWLPLILDEAGNEEPFLSAEAQNASDTGARKRQNQKRSPQALAPGLLGGQGFGEFPGGLPPGSLGRARGRGLGGRGGGRDGNAAIGGGASSVGKRPAAGRGAGRGGRGLSGAGVSSDATIDGTYSGVPMMPMPMMTEWGPQYMHYGLAAYYGMGGMPGMPAMGPMGAMGGMPGMCGGMDPQLLSGVNPYGWHCGGMDPALLGADNDGYDEDDVDA